MDGSRARLWDVLCYRTPLAICPTLDIGRDGDSPRSRLLQLPDISPDAASAHTNTHIIGMARFPLLPCAVLTERHSLRVFSLL